MQFINPMYWFEADGVVDRMRMRELGVEDGRGDGSDIDEDEVTSVEREGGRGFVFDDDPDEEEVGALGTMRFRSVERSGQRG